MKTIHEIQTNSKLHLKGFFLKTDNNFNWNNLFIYINNTIPNEINLYEIDVQRANIWFFENYNSIIKDVFFKKINIEPHFSDIVFILEKDLIIEFDVEFSRIKLLFLRTNYDFILDLIYELKLFSHRADQSKSKINILVSEYNWIGLKPILLKPISINIFENYNSDFEEVHITILNKLSQSDNKGVVLLYGLPGSGKTTYIKHLISVLAKKAIFLPPNMAEYLTNPELTNLLMAHPNSILIIEDAEKILTAREINSNSGISTLLNITDGLLSDFLNIQIICTFNTSISMVDKAILRKGRLIAKYEFKELSIEKTRKLSMKLGFKNEIKKPLTLAEIFNQAEENYSEIDSNKSIGFK